MMNFQSLGKLLVLAGIVLVLLGGFLFLAGKLPGFGRLPGDILIRRKSFSFYFPLVTCLLISVILTIILNLIFRR